jgi:hypothetical protein
MLRPKDFINKTENSNEQLGHGQMVQRKKTKKNTKSKKS